MYREAFLKDLNMDNDEEEEEEIESDDQGE